MGTKVDRGKTISASRVDMVVSRITRTLSFGNIVGSFFLKYTT